MTKINFVKDFSKCLALAVLILASMILGFISPFAIHSVMFDLTHNLVLSALTASGFFALLITSALMGWLTAGLNRVITVFKK